MDAVPSWFTKGGVPPKAPRPYILRDQFIKEIAPRRGVYPVQLGDEILLLRVVGYLREKCGPRRNQLAVVFSAAGIWQNPTHLIGRHGARVIMSVDPISHRFVEPVTYLV